jgi:UDP-N-acetylglucosamine acyltransferase
MTGRGGSTGRRTDGPGGEGPAAGATGAPPHGAGPVLARLLPQRYPLPLVDRVVGGDDETTLVAVKSVSAGAPFFGGHFPGRPLMPGVLLCEALVQAAALLVARAAAGLAPGSVLRLGTLERERFRQPVLPGDRLELEVRVVARRAAAWRFRGTARVGARVVAETDFALCETPGTGPLIDPTAVIAPGARLAPDVRVGPYAVVGPSVQIGAGTTVGPHAVIDGRTTIGAGNRIFQFASVGAEPQDLKYRGEASRLQIGDGNVIREFATINPGTAGGGMLTVLGDGNLLMNYAHVGHDCRIGSHCVLANSTALAGHVILEDWVIVGGLAAVHQFVRIGQSALLGGGAMVVRDVPPFCNASGDRARLRGLNLIGLRRRGFGAERIRSIKRAYRLLFASDLPFAEARERCAAELGESEDVRGMLAFIETSERGISAAGVRAEPDDD